MLNFMMTGALRQYVDTYGASRLLFYGPKRTESITFKLKFEGEGGVGSYEAKLSWGLSDRLVITAEPGYLARFTSTNQVVSYQRRFMNAAKRSDAAVPVRNPLVWLAEVLYDTES